MTITFLGIGNVGAPLADGLAKADHTITIAARDPNSESVKKAIHRNNSLQVAPPADAVGKANVIFLATPYQSAGDALTGLELGGKILVDCTNPVGPGLSHLLQSQTSGSEEIQKLASGATVVKAFTIVGYENFEDSSYTRYADIKPLMLIAGDDKKAKEIVAGLGTELGWSVEDAGPLSSVLHLEHMCLLWIKIARVQGKGPNFVWGYS